MNVLDAELMAEWVMSMYGESLVVMSIDEQLDCIWIG
jgi:hypothetical protein